MYDTSTKFEHFCIIPILFYSIPIIPSFGAAVKLFLLKRRRQKPPLRQLLLTEGHAVGALVNSGIAFMGAHQNALQRAVVGILTVIGALGNGTFDALVCVAAHSHFLLFVDSEIVFTLLPKI